MKLKKLHVFIKLALLIGFVCLTQTVPSISQAIEKETACIEGLSSLDAFFMTREKLKQEDAASNEQINDALIEQLTREGYEPGIVATQRLAFEFSPILKNGMLSRAVAQELAFRGIDSRSEMRKMVSNFLLMSDHQQKIDFVEAVFNRLEEFVIPTMSMDNVDAVIAQAKSFKMTPTQYRNFVRAWQNEKNKTIIKIAIAAEITDNIKLHAQITKEVPWYKYRLPKPNAALASQLPNLNTQITGRDLVKFVFGSDWEAFNRSWFKVGTITQRVPPTAYNIYVRKYARYLDIERIELFLKRKDILDSDLVTFLEESLRQRNLKPYP
jgi:hypothetical protein